MSRTKDRHHTKSKTALQKQDREYDKQINNKRHRRKIRRQELLDEKLRGQKEKVIGP